MKPTYYEGVVLVTIKRLNDMGLPCHQDNLVFHACMGNKTISKAIDRLEQKGRLQVIRPALSNKPFEYVLKEQPTDHEYVLAAVHLADKMVPANGR